MPSVLKEYSKGPQNLQSVGMVSWLRERASNADAEWQRKSSAWKRLSREERILENKANAEPIIPLLPIGEAFARELLDIIVQDAQLNILELKMSVNPIGRNHYTLIRFIYPKHYSIIIEIQLTRRGMSAALKSRFDIAPLLGARTFPRRVILDLEGPPTPDTFRIFLGKLKQKEELIHLIQTAEGQLQIIDVEPAASLLGQQLQASQHDGPLNQAI